MVNPYYCFLDEDKLFGEIKRRWLQSSPRLFQSDESCEALLYGVAAMGSLFSQKDPTPMVHQLSESSGLILEQCMRYYTPTMDLIAAWALRVSYLHLAGTPHMAWIASCTLMHYHAFDRGRQVQYQTTTWYYKQGECLSCLYSTRRFLSEQCPTLHYTPQITHPPRHKLRLICSVTAWMRS